MSHEEKPELQNLEVNRETVADLAEGEAEQAQGGAAGAVLAILTRGQESCVCGDVG